MYCVRYKQSFLDKYREELIKGTRIDLPLGEDRYEIVKTEGPCKGKVFKTYNEALSELLRKKFEVFNGARGFDDLERQRRKKRQSYKNLGDTWEYKSKNPRSIYEPAFRITLKPGSPEYKSLIKLIAEESERSARARKRAYGLTKLIQGDSETEIATGMGVTSGTVQEWAKKLGIIQHKLETGQLVRPIKQEFDS